MHLEFEMLSQGIQGAEAWVEASAAALEILVVFHAQSTASGQFLLREAFGLTQGA